MWRGAHRGHPQPARSALKLVDANPEDGSVTIAFAGIEDFTNPFGEVLGGFLIV